MTPTLKKAKQAKLISCHRKPLMKSLAFFEGKTVTQWAHFIPIYRCGKIIRDCFSPKKYWSKSSVPFHLCRSQAEVLNKGFLCYSGPWSKNFQHFLEETLPRIVYYKDYVMSKSIPLLLPHVLNNTLVHDIIEIIGIPDGSITWLPKDGFSPVDDLYFASTPDREYSLQCLKELQDKCKHMSCKHDSLKNIYISRNNNIENLKNNNNATGSSRIMLNEEELLSGISRFNFTTLHLGGLNIKEKIKLLNNSKTIVCPAGAGVMNIIFTRSLKNLIVLDSGCVQSLVNGWRDLLKKIYGKECKFTHIGPTPPQTTQVKPFTTNVKELVKVLEEI